MASILIDFRDSVKHLLWGAADTGVTPVSYRQVVDWLDQNATAWTYEDVSFSKVRITLEQAEDLTSLLLAFDLKASECSVE